MKKIRIYILSLMCAIGLLGAQAQQVNTLYFLENAPMRPIINPALQPVSDGYIMLPILGYTSMQAGNNSLTMSDLIYRDPISGNTITALHPNADPAKLLGAFRNSTLIGSQVQMNLLSFGFRLKEKGYVHINIMEHMDAGMSLPKPMFEFLLGGGMHDLNGGNNRFDFSALGVNATAYTEIGGGYSHRINDQWTVGGKVKFILGQAYVGVRPSSLVLDASASEWRLHGEGDMIVSAPDIINKDVLPAKLDYQTIQNLDTNALVKSGLTWQNYLKPAGYGGAIDLGFTYKPHKQVQISAAVTDLGLIYWNGTARYKASFDTTFVGVGDFTYDHYVVNGSFDTDSLLHDVQHNAEELLHALHAESVPGGLVRMMNAKLNVGVDANFCNNILGIGILGQGRLYNGRIYGEVTIGGAIRPCNWANIAVSYSLLENGKYSNIGAGLSLMPYDGINLTLAMDYIPTSYAPIDIDNSGKPRDILPYKAKGMNVAMGVSIVWGTNHKKDSDKDGVLDKFDVCPRTPRNVRVDRMGCPLDTDGDGVPDYLDQCPGTPVKAYGLTDSVGCPIDTDGDGVPDYLDRCANTPAAAIGYIDEKGCPLDTDGDGIADYMDECPNTPAEARGHVDEKGCPRDSDGDGVPDYMDECPDTPAEARDYIDEKGCPLDTDKDGVPDYLDECPNTTAAAIGYVDAHGCDLDTDGDGVPDYKDECPTVPGNKLNKGCPEVKREVRNLLKKAMQGIQFETGKATIKPSSYKLLDQIAQTFIDNPSYIIEVQGHTDNVGKAELNKALSDKRAKAVREYLIKKGVEPERMTANGYGMERPIEDNKTAKGRALNRRVEFDITFEEVHIETIYDHADPAEQALPTDSIQPQQDNQ